MPNPIQEFILSGIQTSSSGLFAGDEKAKQIASRMTEKQRKKFKHHDIVPAGFYIWLRESRVIRKHEPIPQGGSTIEQLLDFLRWYPYQTDQAKSTGEYIFRRIIQDETGLPDAAFGLGDHILHPSKGINKGRAVNRN